ncbi:glycoside hydrolase family protein [Bifidobacterium myosotis]|nr:hypothetical protein [Bifidobacterium myosotis]
MTVLAIEVNETDVAAEVVDAPVIDTDNGRVEFDPCTGLPMRFVSADPTRKYLIDSAVDWHTVEHYWGAGFVVTGAGSAHWDAAERTQTGDGGAALIQTYDLAPAGLRLNVTRTGGAKYAERYEWTNITDRPLIITELGIQTPFNDRYPSAKQALAECVNTHVFTGGGWSWVIAEPMCGTDVFNRCLCLKLTEGALAGYSIESRNQNTGSDVRGHIVLQVTDYARNPQAFGGQPTIALEPGASYVLSWELDWYADRDAFLAHYPEPAHFSSFAETVGRHIHVATPLPVSAITDGLDIEASNGGYYLTASEPGTYYVRIGTGPDAAKTEVLFHRSLQDTVVSRAAYIASHQIAADRPGSMSGAFVPVDTRTGLRADDGGWPDWTDGSERIGMAVMLQKAINQEWLGADYQGIVDRWFAFVKDWLINDRYEMRRGSSQPKSTFGGRLYDVPWMVEFCCDHYRATGDAADLYLAVGLLERLNELGGERFLSISYGETVEYLSRLLDKVGRANEADQFRKRVVASANHFISVGEDLPAHEVAYEQSVVAPLVNLMLSAYRFTGNADYLAAAEGRLDWLLSFGGPQPDCRLYGISIRHWDGHWFGINRMFGDVFPHYWSALTATALVRLPAELHTPETNRLADAILRENMANYNADGSATCAFVFPSSVDGRAANVADPLANDQDWHLAMWLRLIQNEGLGCAER